MPRDKLEQIVILPPNVGRRRFMQAGLGILGAAAATSLLSACGSLPGVGGSTKALDKPTFQLRWIKNVQFGGFFAAIEKGYFKDEGIDANIVGGGPNVDVHQVVSGGGAVIGYGTAERIIRGRSEQSIPMKVFGANYQTPPACFMVLADKSIRTAKDFSGKKLAISAQGRPMLEAMMTHANVPPDSVTVIPVGIEPSALATGEADIYQGFSTNQGTMLEQKGLKIHYITYQDLGYEIYDGPLFALDETFDKNEDLLVRFLRASIKGWEYNNAHPDEVAEITVKKYAQEGLDLEQQKIENKAQVPLTESELTKQKGLFWMTEARWENTVKFLVDAKSIPAPLKTQDIVTTKILEKAFGGKSKLL